MPDYSHAETYSSVTGDWSWTDRPNHEFLPVNGHPDDDECTHREDGTDATYCGRQECEHR